MTERKRDNAILVTIILALLSIVVSGYASYSHNDKDITSRVTAVEVKQGSDHEAIQRIELKQDRTNDKLDRLVEWALGSK